MVKREGMPAEIVESKKKDLKKLKQEQTYKKNAIRNQSKYRAIRLNEKKKWDRARKRCDKQIQVIQNKIIPEGMEYEEFEKLKEKEIGEQNEILEQTDKDQDYITYFPLNEKYISLYIKTEMPEEVLAKRELLREKAHKLKMQKMGVKRREMKLADKVDDEVTGDKYDQKKPREVSDTFFVPSDQEVEEDEYTRIVDKVGKVIKIEDPIRARIQRSKEKGAYSTSYSNNNENKKPYEKPRAFPNKGKPAKPQPIKIKARNYRVSNANLATAKKTHVKF
jgi:hypothetical protein